MKSRKEFIQLVVGVGTFLTTGFLFGKTKDSSSGEIPLPPGEEPVSETDPTVKALGYNRNANNVDATRFPERNSRGKKQVCKNCYNYTVLNNGWGKCNVLNKGVVSSAGWCSAWAPKE
jgi:hypothetical protein